MTPPRKAELALIAVTVIWGTTFTLVKSALDDASVATFLALRFGLAAAALFAVHRGRGMAAGQIPWVPGGITGLILGLSYILQTAGLLRTTPSKSAFLTALNVVLVPFFTALVYKSIPRGSDILGVVMAMAGTGMMMLPGGRLGDLGGGDLLTLGCAAAFAVHILVTGHYAPHVDPAGFILVQVSTVAAIAGAWHLLGGQPAVRWSPRLLLALGVTSLLCTALAYTVQARAQQETGSTRVALIFAMEPVAAAATSYLAAGERLTPGALLGALLILAGVLVAELQPLGRPKHP
jgi:drug/metabolite transporter (DMT)-like permease